MHPILVPDFRHVFRPGDAARLTALAATGRVIVDPAATTASVPLAAFDDAFVLQLAGTGLWSVCIPRAEVLVRANPAATDAERCTKATAN